MHGRLKTGGLTPGIYALEAKTGAAAGQAPQTARWQVIVAPNLFGW